MGFTLISGANLDSTSGEMVFLTSTTKCASSMVSHSATMSLSTGKAVMSPQSSILTLPLSQAIDLYRMGPST